MFLLKVILKPQSKCIVIRSRRFLSFLNEYPRGHNTLIRSNSDPSVIPQQLVDKSTVSASSFSFQNIYLLLLTRLCGTVCVVNTV